MEYLEYVSLLKKENPNGVLASWLLVDLDLVTNLSVTWSKISSQNVLVIWHGIAST